MKDNKKNYRMEIRCEIRCEGLEVDESKLYFKELEEVLYVCFVWGGGWVMRLLSELRLYYKGFN